MSALRKPARDLDAAVRAFRLDLHQEYKGEVLEGGHRVAIHGLRLVAAELAVLREFLGAAYVIEEAEPKSVVPGTDIVWCVVDVRKEK